MKQLPEVNASFEDLYRMLIAPIESKLMLAGIELGVFYQGEIADSMLRVGFRSIRSRTLDMNRGLMDLDIGRK